MKPSSEPTLLRRNDRDPPHTHVYGNVLVPLMYSTCITSAEELAYVFVLYRHDIDSGTAFGTMSHLSLRFGTSINFAFNEECKNLGVFRFRPEKSSCCSGFDKISNA
jgi:hypothetical protein